MALASVAFIRGLYGAEDLFERRIPHHEYIRHSAGMLGVGAMNAGELTLAMPYDERHGVLPAPPPALPCL